MCPKVEMPALAPCHPRRTQPKGKLHKQPPIPAEPLLQHLEIQGTENGCSLCTPKKQRDTSITKEEGVSEETGNIMRTSLTFSCNWLPLGCTDNISSHLLRHFLFGGITQLVASLINSAMNT